MQATPRFGWSIDSQIQVQLDSRNAGQSNGGSCLDALIPSGSSEGPGRDGYSDAPCPLLGAPGIPSPGIAAKPVLGSEGCGSGQWAGRFELVSSWTGVFRGQLSRIAVKASEISRTGFVGGHPYSL